jgi:hypothetical protein
MLRDFLDRAEGNERGYNELVFSFDVWSAQLPATVEAFFYPLAAECARVDDCEARTRRAHHAFTAAYPQSAVPLLTLDPTDWHAPFAVAPVESMRVQQWRGPP